MRALCSTLVLLASAPLCFGDERAAFTQMEAGPYGRAHRVVFRHRLVERLPHAMQALELDAAGTGVARPDRGQGLRVVGRELRMERVPVVDHELRTGEE